MTHKDPGAAGWMLKQGTPDATMLQKPWALSREHSPIRLGTKMLLEFASESSPAGSPDIPRRVSQPNLSGASLHSCRGSNMPLRFLYQNATVFLCHC